MTMETTLYTSNNQDNLRRIQEEPIIHENPEKLLKILKLYDIEVI